MYVCSLFFFFVPKCFSGRQNFRLDLMEYHVGRISLELVNNNSLLKSGCRVLNVHWSLCMNVGVYNQAQGHLPLPPPPGTKPLEHLIVNLLWQNGKIKMDFKTVMG